MANTKVTGDLIASSTIATGNIADNAVTSDKISGITTAHITEGANLYYTDARADARAALLVDSAPSTLNTLNELAAALGDDPNFATTVTNSIATKLPLAGGTLTGALQAQPWLFRQMSSQVEYHVLDNGNLNGPSWKFRYDGTTSNRYVDFGFKDGAGNYVSGLKLHNNSTVSWRGADIINANAQWVGDINTSADIQTGGIEASGNVALTSTAPLLYLNNTTASTGKNWRFSSATNGKFFITQEGVIDAVTLDHTTGNATFAGNVIGARGFFNSGATNVVATFTSTDGTATLQCADPTGNVEFGASGNNFVVQPAGGAAQLTVGSSSSTFASPIYLLNTDARISAGGSGEVGFNYNTGATGSLVWYGGGTASKFNVTSAGRTSIVGVFESSASQGILNLKQSSGVGSLGMGFHDAGSNPHFWLQSRSNSNYATTYNLALQPTGGNTGIGTTSPGEKLEVKGNIVINSQSTSSATTELDQLIFRKLHPNGASSGFYNQASIRSKTFGGYSGGLNFYTNKSLGAGSYGERLAMSIDNFQNVGIGKSQSGNAVLTARSSAGGNTGMILIEGDTTDDGWGMYATTANRYVITRFTGGSYSDKFHILEGGNVGIGTDSPVSKLEVGGSIKVTGVTPNIGAAAGLSLSYDSGINYINTWGSSPLITSTYNYQAFHISGSEKIRIHTNGNIGIGQTGPGQKLVIGNYGSAADGTMRLTALGGQPTAGTIRNSLEFALSSEFSVNSGDAYKFSVGLNSAVGNSGSYNSDFVIRRTTRLGITDNVDFMIDGTSGNAGIGTTSPDEKLEVNGNIKAADLEGKFFSNLYTATTQSQVDTISYTGTGMWEYNIRLNPNPGGSSAYADFYYGRVGIGGGYNGQVGYHLWSQQDQIAPRNLYPSGGGNKSLTWVMVKSDGSEVTNVAYGVNVTLRVKGFGGNSYNQDIRIYLRRLA